MTEEYWKAKHMRELIKIKEKEEPERYTTDYLHHLKRQLKLVENSFKDGKVDVIKIVEEGIKELKKCRDNASKKNDLNAYNCFNACLGCLKELLEKLKK